MAELTAQPTAVPVRATGGRTKFLVGGAILLAAVALLIYGGVTSKQESFVTVEQLTSNPQKYIDKAARITGAVIGETIQEIPEGETYTLKFEIAHVPDNVALIEDEGGLAIVLHRAVTDPDAARILVIVVNQPKPDLLKNEAQAILAGKLGADGVFYADELLLKCPTKYEEAHPDRVGEN